MVVQPPGEACHEGDRGCGAKHAERGRDQDAVAHQFEMGSHRCRFVVGRRSVADSPQPDEVQQERSKPEHGQDVAGAAPAATRPPSS